MKQSRRNTSQRQLIRQLLTDNITHPTADEVYELARKTNPTISRGTVYRNLNLLADEGEIARLMMPMGADHYDSETNRHYHFLCRKCNKLMDTTLPYYDKFNDNSFLPKGCQAEWHRLVFVGLCPDCSKEEGTPKK